MHLNLVSQQTPHLWFSKGCNSFRRHSTFYKQTFYWEWRSTVSQYGKFFVDGNKINLKTISVQITLRWIIYYLETGGRVYDSVAENQRLKMVAFSTFGKLWKLCCHLPIKAELLRTFQIRWRHLLEKLNKKSVTKKREKDTHIRQVSTDIDVVRKLTCLETLREERCNMHVTTIQGEKTGSIDKKKVRSCKAPNNDKKFGKKQKNYDSEIKDIELLGQPHLTRVVLVLKKKNSRFDIELKPSLVWERSHGVLDKRMSVR